MSDHQHCINCLEEVEGSYLYPCVQCGWSPDQYSETGLYLSPGTILNNQYQIGKMLGHGGFGITYLAWDNLLHRRLAIKEYMPRDFATRNATNSTISIYAGAATESFAYGLERFLDEARTLAKFQQYAGIVSVLNVFYGNSTGYMVMEYVEGRTLKDYLLEKGLLSWELTLQLFMPIMDALREVHKGGIMHRDISPDNIYLCNDNRIKLLDFGSARYALGGHSLSLSVVVKPGYAPEEQYRAKGKQGPWTDVYSVAASMYRCICGEVPPDALDRLDEDELVAPSNLGIQISQKAEAALMSALAIKANDRTQSIEAFQQEIWDQANLNEPVTRKANDSKKVSQPTTTKEEESIIIELPDGETKTYAFFKNNQMLLPIVNGLKTIHYKGYLSLIGVLVIVIFVNPSAHVIHNIWVESYDEIGNFWNAARGEQVTEDRPLIDGKGSLYYKINGKTEYVDSENSPSFVSGIPPDGRPYYGALDNNGSEDFYWNGVGIYDGEKIPVGDAYKTSHGLKAFDEFHKSAVNGNPEAQYNIGFMFERGELGVNQDYQQAFNWYLKSAEQGHAFAQFRLGNLYRDGYGVNQDYQQAFYWYLKSAEQGHAFAQIDLGNLYRHGYGVTRDYKKAAEWYRKAAEQGDSNGQNFLGLSFELGYGVPQNEAEAIKWYRLAAEQGDALAISALKRLGVK